MTIPAFHDARNDHALAGAPLAVYLHLLHDVLDPVEFRPVKQEALAVRMGYSLRTIASALHVLTDQRYLATSPVKGGETRLYRLVYSRLP